MLKRLSIVTLALLALPAIADAQQIAARTMVVSGTPHVTRIAQSAATAANAGSTFKDEYGNLYNSRGDRIDRAGRILPPPVTPPGARALR
jgi:hypothetical protein